MQHNSQREKCPYSANQWTGVYMMGTSVRKELIRNSKTTIEIKNKQVRFEIKIWILYYI